MKKIVLFLIFVAYALTAMAQVSIGMRDTRYIFASYTMMDHYSATIEQSIYSEKPGFQYTRLYLSYRDDLPCHLHINVAPYYGMAWNNNYRNLGVLAGLRFKPCIAGVYAIVNPHYDSTYHYKTMFRAGAEINITKEIGIFSDYNTIPVYREKEDRIRAGASFKVRNLDVRPVISIPVSGNHKYNSVRVQMSFGYTFR